MITVAVFDHGPRLHSAILYGVPARDEVVADGRLARFHAQALVLYAFVTQRVQTFLFHGLGSVRVPGVTPAVNLVAHALGATESRRLETSIRWLVTHGQVPEAVSDARWLRLGAVLNRAHYGVRDLRAVLAYRP